MTSTTNGQFELDTLDAQGKLKRLVVLAADEADAIRQIENSGCRVVDVHYARRPLSERLPFPRTSFDLTLFLTELIVLLRAGLSLTETLDALADRQSAQANSNQVLATLLNSLKQGKSLSAALEAYPTLFPELLVATVAASEITGEMVPALQRYLRYGQEMKLLRDRIRSASVYPLLLLTVGVCVALFLLFYLVPKFSGVYEGMEASLPASSRWLLQWGQWISNHGWMAVILLTGLVFAVAGAFSQTKFRAFLWIQLRKIEWVNNRLSLIHLSRYFRSLGLLLHGGISLPKALKMACRLLPEALHGSADNVAIQVMQGKKLSDSLFDQNLMTPVGLRLLRAGERNGQMAEMFEQAATFHDAELSHWLDKFTRLFEPLLMLIIGGVIGCIVIMLYLPIFDLASGAR